MPQTDRLRPGDPWTLGGYRLTGRLGSGSQGAVYLAYDSYGSPIAVKTLHADWVDDPEQRARFAREVAAARSVASFCTARILDADTDGPLPYIVSEYVPGPSLRQAVERDGPIRGGDLHRLALGTATALAAIHRAGIVHRDFKPDNVLLSPEGPRVIDFGIARAGDAKLTTTGKTIGTPAYMAPEQANGEAVAPATDLFSWAEVMVYAAAGRPPFGDDTPIAVVARLLNMQPDVSGVEWPLRDVVAECLAKRPADRLQNGDALVRSLESVWPVGAPPRATVIPVPAPRGGLTSPPVPAGFAEPAPSGPPPHAAAARPAQRASGSRRSAIAAGIALAVCACLVGAVCAYLLGGGSAGGTRPASLPGHGEWRGISHDVARADMYTLVMEAGGKRGTLGDGLSGCRSLLRHRAGERFTVSRGGAPACLKSGVARLSRGATNRLELRARRPGTGARQRVVFVPAHTATSVPPGFVGRWRGVPGSAAVGVGVVLGHRRGRLHSAGLRCTGGLRPWFSTSHTLVVRLKYYHGCAAGGFVQLAKARPGALRYRVYRTARVPTVWSVLRHVS